MTSYNSEFDFFGEYVTHNNPLVHVINVVSVDRL